MVVRRDRWIWLPTIALLLIAASRIFRLDIGYIRPGPDEVWSIWQTFGSAADVVRWTPYDWPPGYYLTLWLWQNLVGLHPIVLRMLSVLALLIGCAGMYRAARSLFGARAGLFVVLAYAGLGYVIFLSIELRGYALLLGLFPLTLWQTVRYFRRPLRAQGIVLGVLLGLMLYVSLTSAAAIFMLIVFSALLWRRTIWRWWLPMVVATLLFIPELINKASLAVARVDALRDLTIATDQALLRMYVEFAGYGFPVAVFFFLLAVVLLLWRRRLLTRPGLAVAIWCAFPVILYATHGLFGFFYARYAWWVMPGLALWIGYGLSLLPRPGRGLAYPILVALLFLEIPLQDYMIPPSNLSRGYAEMARYAHAGDVLLVDPTCDCFPAIEAEYYRRVYFPLGLPVVAAADSYRRVWFLSNWRPDEAIKNDVSAGRLAMHAFGPATARFTLYEAPPDREGTLYENGMTFHGIQFLNHAEPLVVHEGERVPVRLWWSADREIDRDYSVGLYLLNSSGELVHQSDGPPAVQTGVVETSHWPVGPLFYEDRELVIPYPSGRATYRIYLGVYYWETNERVPAPGQVNDRLLPLGRVEVMAW